MSIADRVLGINDRVSQQFVNNIGRRRLIRSEHPTEFAVFECSDGRVDLAMKCGLPLGLLTVFENIGGIFNLGWQSLAYEICQWEQYAHDMRVNPCIIVTYHYSLKGEHFNCAGVGYDTELAIRNARLFKSQIDCVFSGRIFTVLAGIETDNGSLDIWGDDDQRPLSTGDIKSVDGVGAEIIKRFKSFPGQIVNDLIWFIEKNVGRLLAGKHRFIKPHHNESVVFVGSGFDWLTSDMHNFALTINGFDPKIEEAIRKALGIVYDNSLAGRVDEGLVLTAFAYRSSVNSALAELHARHYETMVRSVVGQRAEHKDFFKFLCGVVDMGTRKLSLI